MGIFDVQGICQGMNRFLAVSGEQMDRESQFFEFLEDPMRVGPGLIGED